MSLESWDRIKPHLDFITHGAEMASRHARALPSKSEFRCGAQDVLEDAERTLETALQKVREAMREYDRKEIA